MWLLSPEIVLILFTRGLPCVQCAKNCTTCEYYTANYRIFLEHQLNSKRFPRAISNSRRFQGLPGVVDILLLLQKFVTVRCAPSAAAAFTQVRRSWNKRAFLCCTWHHHPQHTNVFNHDATFKTACQASKLVGVTQKSECIALSTYCQIPSSRHTCLYK